MATHGDGKEEFVDPLLRIKGVTPQLAEALRDAGYFTIESVAIEPPHLLFERVGERAGFSLKKAQDITAEARKHLKVKVQTLEELEAEESKRQVISTNCMELDELLGGGVRTGELTGVSGPYSVGKTELVFTLALNTVEDLNAGAWIIDTEGTTSAKRLLEMAKAWGLQLDIVKKKIVYSRIIGTADLIATIEFGFKIISDYNIKFIGVDTLVNPFRAEYPGRDLLTTRQYKLNRCLRRLLDYARLYDLAVLVTNQVRASPQPTSPFETRPEVLNPPTGGHVFLYVVNNHLYLERLSSKTFRATLIDSSYLPRGQARYTITECGIADVEEAKKRSKKGDEEEDIIETEDQPV
ncbi:MAG: helix-hairpin-helix domain-containing protein [Thermofilum sp.]